MPPRISKKQAEQFKSQARDKKARIMGQAKKNLSTEDKKELKRLNAIIKDADAVIRGDGGKKGY